MQVEPTVMVGYEGKQYQIPADIARLNSRQPGAAKAWIEDQIAEETLREEKRRERKQDSVEAEFTSVKTRLSELESKEAVINNLSRENKSLKAAVEAQATQIDALESSGNAAGSASAEARETAYSLANASTIAQGTLSNLQRENERLNTTVEAMRIQLESLQDQFDDQATKALAAGQTRQRLEQEKTNRLLNDVARAEAVALKAEAVASQALSNAKAAQSLSRNDITRENIVAMVQNEVQASSEGIAESVIAQMQNQFPQGLGGIRMDAEYMAQTANDRTTAVDIRFGTDEAFKKNI